ncbi:contractile injection system tape measure protein [uncultured Flavobacterium sp.]|uniref:contractile injection system tape measure protein n=1 Tax=uncultured Flavobacterium sp. TaxID=165435 RepID=UPI0030813B41
MLNSNKHIINKVFLEINTNSKEKGYYLKDNIDAFLQQEIFKVLENYFDELDSKNPSHSIQLDKLNIDIAINQNLNFEDFKEQILNKITKQVEEVFEKEDSNNIEGYKVIKPQEKEIESFFYFLETGTNAWWTTLDHNFKIVDDHVFGEILNDESFSFKWKNTVRKPIARTRFIKQFNDEQIVTIIKKGILLKKNSADGNSKIIRIEAIKKQIETRISKNQLIPNQRFLMWEIVIFSLLETSDLILKQKLFRLICNVFEFHKKNNFLQHTELFLKEIENQIENQNELKLLANLNATILYIEKKLDKIILKGKESEKETFQKNQAQIKPETESETKNKTKIEAEIEAEKISENKETTTPDPDFISIKNKEETVLNNEKNIESISNDSEEKMPNNDEKVIDKKELSLDKKENILEADISGLYVENAGLMLIHPFLKSLFVNCKLLDKDNTINDPEVATHLLHYVATGQEQDYENAMTFEKFLCNIPIDEPIERNIILSEEMKKEASEMLQAVLDNWDIMKKSSAELLQNEFLQRPGKLSVIGDENPTIIIERKTQDVLLDKLSWNLSIIKLAWKKRIIYVNW